MRDVDRTEGNGADSAGANPKANGHYVPPVVEDIDTAHEPAETVAGVITPTLGAEESERWH